MRPSPGSCQCFTNTDCTGCQVVSSSQRDCCVETDDGLSYNDGSTCNQCRGKYIDLLIERDPSCSERVSTERI